MTRFPTPGRALLSSCELDALLIVATVFAHLGSGTRQEGTPPSFAIYRGTPSLNPSVRDPIEPSRVFECSSSLNRSNWALVTGPCRRTRCGAGAPSWRPTASD